MTVEVRRERARVPPHAAPAGRAARRQGGLPRRWLPGDLLPAHRARRPPVRCAPGRAGHRPRRPLRGAGAQRPRVPRAVARRVPRRGCHQPAQPAPGCPRARVHPEELGDEGGLHRLHVRERRRPGSRGGRHREGRADRRARRAPRPEVRGPRGRRRAAAARRARRGRSRRAHVHGRHHGPAEGRAARPAGRDAQPLPRRHDLRSRRPHGEPQPDADVPRRDHGRHPRGAGRRRHLDLRLDVRPGEGPRRGGSPPRHVDGDGSDDDRAGPQPPRVPTRAPVLARGARLRRLPDAHRAARAPAVALPRPARVPGLRHDRGLRRAHRARSRRAPRRRAAASLGRASGAGSDDQHPRHRRLPGAERRNR